MIKEKGDNKLGSHLEILKLGFPQELEVDSFVQLTSLSSSTVY